MRRGGTVHPEIACDVTALAEDQYGKIGGSSENSSPVLFCDPLSTRPLDPSERSVRSVGIPFVFQQALGESYRMRLTNYTVDDLI